MPNNPSLSETKTRQQQTKTLLLTIAAVLGALLACFCFGFFVLARLMPVKTAENSSPQVASQPSNTSQVANPAPATEDRSTIPTVPAEPKRSSKEGPSIEADTHSSLSTPSSSENNSGTSPEKQENRDDPSTSDDNENRRTEKRNRKGQSAEGESVQEPASLEKKPRERHRREADVDRNNTDETPSGTERRDENKTEETNTRETRQAEPATKPEESTPRLHRVQVGAYSSKEAAETAMNDLHTKGIETKVRRIKRNGKSLYSLQSGAYKSRESAEAKRQKLQDAGQDAYITQD